MEKTRPILYGVADYALMRKKNGWFLERSAMAISHAGTLTEILFCIR